MSDIETIRRIAEYAPHWLTPEDHHQLRLHDPVNVKRARRWPYVVAIACAVALATLPTWAEPVSIYGGQATIDIGPSDRPGAFAEVTFQNYLEAAPGSVDVMVLHHGGIGVAVDIQLGPYDVPDRMTVVPPHGYIAEPPFIDVAEGDAGTIVIYSIEGVGM